MQSVSYKRPGSFFSTSTLSLLLCAAVISSCGASKNEKRAVQPIAAPSAQTLPAPTTSTTATPEATATTTLPQPAPTEAGAPVGQQTGETGSTPAGEAAAPVGRVNNDNSNSGGTSENDDKKQPAQTSVPDFKDAQAVKTGGKVGALSYTSAADDGIMKLFLENSTKVSQAQQTMNSNLAQAINGARLRKSGAGMVIDLATIEFGQARIYRMSATNEGDKYRLSATSSGGDLEFQGGFVKCLDDSCDNAYAKIKMEGAYARIIFRTMTMDNHFQIQKDIQDSGFLQWKNYITNSVTGADSSARIQSVTASSYEVLNGKAAMGIQLLTNDSEALVLNTLLVAPETGTALTQKVTKVTDLSDNYNLASTAGKAKNLSNLINEVNLVNNNGQGALKIRLSFNDGSIWMVLSPAKKAGAMTADQVRAFEATVPNF